jgi:hypothetical protein
LQNGKKDMNMRRTLIVLISILFLVSCGGKEVKKVSPESKLVQEAFEFAETLKNAYLRNDRISLERNSTQEAYKELIGGIKKFDNAELTLTPTWVEIQDSTVKITVSWKGTWTVTGKTTEERGIGIFVLEGIPLKLVQIQRANPFRQPE